MKRLFALAALLCAGCASTEFSRPPVVTAIAPFTPDSGSIAVLCGTVFVPQVPLTPPDGIDIVHDSVVIIRDGRVVGVYPESAFVGATVVTDGVETRIPSLTHGLPLLDLTEYFCLPGLIDMHTHLNDRPEDTADLRVYFSRGAEEIQRQSQENAAATVLAGFTSVRNVGTYVQGSDFALRDAINAGRVIGPRMQASGPYLTIPHGGGDLFVPDFTEPDDNARFHAGVARGPEQFAARAQALLDTGADLLKVIASGAVLAYGGVPGAPEMTQEEIAAVVDVAHAAGRKVAAHAHGAESIRMAIAAGADTIEHASYLDDAGIAAALASGHVAFSMDVYNGDYIDTEGRRMHWPEEFLRKNLETTEIQRQAFSKAVAADAPVVYGTDSAVYPHGANARQFRIMVERGMTPMQAIRAATANAAKYMGWADRVGTLEPGAYGDVIAVRGDPLVDITVLEHVEAVIKGGLVLKRPRESLAGNANR